MMQFFTEIRDDLNSFHDFFLLMVFMFYLTKLLYLHALIFKMKQLKVKMSKKTQYNNTMVRRLEFFSNFWRSVCT